MLNKILNNLKMYPEDECYEINDKVYKNKDLYKYVCNIYNYLLKNNPNRKSVIVYGHKDIYMIASFLACSFAGMAYIPVTANVHSVGPYKLYKFICLNLFKTLSTVDFVNFSPQSSIIFNLGINFSSNDLSINNKSRNDGVKTAKFELLFFNILNNVT